MKTAHSTKTTKKKSTLRKAEREKALAEEYLKIFRKGVGVPAHVQESEGASFRLFSLYDTSKYQTTTVSSASF